jgi:pimeloyl-ACP methyl ester carboxylesterase
MGELVVGGTRLEVDWIGPGPAQAPTLVFLHEGLGCAAMWRDFPAALAGATGLGALVYSRVGYGGSDPVPLPRPLSYVHYEGQRSLGALLDAAGVTRAILVGHSDGGSIGLVLEAPHVFVEDLSIRSIERAREAYERGDLRARLARYHGTNVDGAFWGWNRAWLDPDFRQWNLEGLLPSVRIPVLVIQGDEDPYGTLRQVDAIERGVGGRFERRVLAGCGHSPHRDQRELTLEAMARFVAGLSAGPAAS